MRKTWLVLFGAAFTILNFALLWLPSKAVIANSDYFFDNLDSYDTSRWNKADGWTNNGAFNVGWRSDHISHSNSIMTISLDDLHCPGGCSSKPYASGEYRTTGSESAAYYGYGCYEARFKVASGSGLVTSFFTYNGGDWDTPPGGNGLHNEIDIEILGKDTTRMQANYYTNSWDGHEHVIDLGFDAAKDFHNYAFQWTETGIQWYVDGSLVYSVENTADTPTPNAVPEYGGSHKIMMNFWAVDPTCTSDNPDCPGAVDWAGVFTYTEPVSAIYDWVKFRPNSDCSYHNVYIPLVMRNYSF